MSVILKEKQCKYYGEGKGEREGRGKKNGGRGRGGSREKELKERERLRDREKEKVGNGGNGLNGWHKRGWIEKREGMVRYEEMGGRGIGYGSKEIEMGIKSNPGKRLLHGSVCLLFISCRTKEGRMLILSLFICLCAKINCSRTDTHVCSLPVNDVCTMFQ